MKKIVLLSVVLAACGGAEGGTGTTNDALAGLGCDAALHAASACLDTAAAACEADVAAFEACREEAGEPTGLFCLPPLQAGLPDDLPCSTELDAVRVCIADCEAVLAAVTSACGACDGAGDVTGAGGAGAQ